MFRRTVLKPDIMIISKYFVSSWDYYCKN